MAFEDLSDVIEDSITDAELPEPTEAPQEPSEPVEATETPAEGDSPSTPADEPTEPQDDFDKKFGLSSQSSSGRENRIPYSRVKKITEKALNDAKAGWTKEMEASYVPATKFAELETKTKDYETRLGQVAEFEKIMATDQKRFLEMLYRQPGYAEIFDQLAAPQAPATPVEAPAPPVTVGEAMPEPDQDLSDGSKVYSLDGLKSLLAWQDRQTEAKTVEKVMKQVEARYAPLESSFNSYQKVQSVIPHVKKQISEARTWHLFNENEDEIVKVLQSNQNVTLERAYQTVVFPKMQAEHERLTQESKVNKDLVRAEVLKELKMAPRSTSVNTGQTRPVATPTSGPRALEDVITDSLKSIR